jgi:hypothetical protein
VKEIFVASWVPIHEYFYRVRNSNLITRSDAHMFRLASPEEEKQRLLRKPDQCGPGHPKAFDKSRFACYINWNLQSNLLNLNLEIFRLSSQNA